MTIAEVDMNGNLITLVGNLTGDPDVRFTSAGKAYAKFSIADNFSYKKGDDWEKKTSFFDCTAWGDIAENIAESLTQGARVIACGRVEQQNWETEEGERRSKLAVEIDSIGPDLRFAVAEVTKIEQEGSSAPKRSKRNSGSRGTKRGSRRQEEYDDEEPF
jgi:single-strand DNA-binding protein